METEIQVGQVKTISEIVTKIKFLEDLKAEFTLKKTYDNIKRLSDKLEMLYWVLGAFEK